MARRKSRRGTAGTWILPAALAVFLALALGADWLVRARDFWPLEPIGEVASDALLHTQEGERLDLNRASVDDLRQLAGIGDTLAERIVRWRQENGGFDRVEQLTEVEGIGEGKLEAIRPYITVGGGP